MNETASFNSRSSGTSPSGLIGNGGGDQDDYTNTSGGGTGENGEFEEGNFEVLAEKVDEDYEPPKDQVSNDSPFPPHTLPLYN